MYREKPSMGDRTRGYARTRADAVVCYFLIHAVV